MKANERGAWEARHRLVAVLVALWLAGAPGCTPAAARLDCRFTPVERAEDELADCARPGDDGSPVFSEEAIARIRARASEPVAVEVGDALYYANAAGRSAPVLWYDNGPDYFVEGLARTPRDGKIGFIDRDLVVRIEPGWSFAFPFQHGVARVCQGCREHEVGEHREVRGGKWGYIDHEGVEVVPVRFERDDLPEPPAR